MAQAYKETTVWEDGNTAINHTYLLEGDLMLGYMRTGTSVPFFFKNPYVSTSVDVSLRSWKTIHLMISFQLLFRKKPATT